jgi:hypothetical protein
MALAILAVSHANDPWAVPQQVSDLSAHDQLVAGFLPAGVRDHVEEIPLRYQCNVLMTARQPSQVGDSVRTGIEHDAESVDPTRGKSGELLPQSEFVQQGQGGGVYRVAAKVA